MAEVRTRGRVRVFGRAFRLFVLLCLVHVACQDSGGNDGGTSSTNDAGSDIPECIAAGDACTGMGTCILDPDGEVRCHLRCDVVGQECEVLEGVKGACYKYEDNWVLVCLVPGTAVGGDACGIANDCEAGTQCWPGAQGKRCFKVCDTACDAGDCCSAGTCTDTGEWFGLCMDANGEPTE